MKTCIKGLHQYDLDKQTSNGCLECKKDKAKEYWKIKTKDPKHRAWKKAKRQTAKWKATQKAYEQTPEYKATKEATKNTQSYKDSQAAYGKSIKGKATSKKYRQSEKGKAKRKAGDKKYKGTQKYRDSLKSPKRKAQKKAYQQSPKGKAQDKIQRARRSVIGAKGDLTTEQIDNRLKEFEGQCAYCSIQLTHENTNAPTYYNIEHIIPIAKKGENTLSNVVPSCQRCNKSKYNKDVHVWMSEKKLTPSEKLAAILDNLFPNAIVEVLEIFKEKKEDTENGKVYSSGKN